MEQIIKEKLQPLQPKHLTVVDENPGSPRGSYSYIRLDIVSDKFEGKSLLEKHQLVYSLLQQEMKQIHALTLKCRTPSEQSRQ
jgi:stress-induced morphogen